MSERQVFISHSARDAELVNSLVTLLKAGVGMREEQYFYTSGAGAAVAPGDDFVARIRDELVDCKLAIELITPSYLESRFCLCELGAVWVSTKQNFPIRTPSVDANDLDGVLGNIQVPQVEECLDDLAQRVGDVLGVKFTLANWNGAKKDFLNDLEDILAKIPPGRQVSFEEYSRVANLVAETETKLNKSQEALRKAVTLGDKLDYSLAAIPPLLRMLNDIPVAAEEDRRALVDELELSVVQYAYQLYGRRDLRAVVWHHVDGQFEASRSRFGWKGPLAAPDADRVKALCDLLRQFRDIWVDDPLRPDHAESLRFGGCDQNFPSFVLVPLIAGDRNLGFLEVGAPAGNPLTGEDVQPVAILAAMLAGGLAAQVAPNLL
jgi:hypothetical protein